MPYDTIEEAIEIANDTRYALGASVFGPDKYECLEVARHLECGMVSINDFGAFYVSTIPVEFSKDLLTPHTVEVCEPNFNKCCAALLTFFLGSQDLPFGGTKSSGYGRFGQR
jgi:acyl-CoA reductase-like NAD-dependent aldehyde dehydrogenase